MKKQLFYLASALLFIYTEASSQNFTYQNVSIKKVTFSNGNLSIRKDDGTGKYTAPQWSSTASTQSPVAYVSGKAPTVSASFNISCANVPSAVYIRGNGPEGIDFPSVKVNVDASSTLSHGITYPATSSVKVFPSGIARMFNPFTIEWEVSFDNGITWKSAGTSANTLYVTRSTPQAENGEYKWFHTVFDLSCRNADQQSQDADIISHIWNEFTDHVVLNHNGDSLFYYKDMSNLYVSLEDLLAYKDAECFTFAQLFLAAIKIQGIVRTNNYVNITPRGDYACGYQIDCFLVKDWTFGSPSASSACASFPYKNTYSELIAYPYTSYTFITADVKDQKGIPGPCTPNPSSFFNNHQIAKIDGVYYDACYGVTFQSLAEIKTKAFSGWAFLYYDGSSNGMLATKNLNATDLMETITTF